MLAKDVQMQGLKIDKLETVISTQALQDERIMQLSKQLDELRHWRGFIDRPDGEYPRRG